MFLGVLTRNLPSVPWLRLMGEGPKTLEIQVQPYCFQSRLIQSPTDIRAQVALEESTIRLWGKNNPGPVRQRAAVVDSLWDLWGMAWAGSEQRAARTAPFGVCVASPLQGNQHFPLPATNTNTRLASKPQARLSKSI
jgi:hypothetical protein